MIGLIGHTGFVGKNLQKSITFDMLFNSKNVNDVSNYDFDVLYCAAPSAVKYLANKNPIDDLNSINNLISNLNPNKISKLIHISTIDVYPNLSGMYEDSIIKYPEEFNNMYGIHRRKLEEHIISNFTDYHIVRLPALFGDGLKKNVIFDLINDNNVELINLNCKFQYYSLDDLYEHINLVVSKGIKEINLFTEPIKTEEMIDYLFAGKKYKAVNNSSEITYNLKTKYDYLFGNSDGYISSKSEILNKLKEYVLHF